MTSKHISTMVVGSHCLSMNSLGPNLLCLTFAKISSCFIMNNVLSARKCGPSTDKFTSADFGCFRCKRNKLVHKKFSAENDMDPGPVPPCLQGLSQVEEMLIARALPIMSVYRKKGGQRGYCGHVLNIPQDIQEFVNTTPSSTWTSISTIICPYVCPLSHRTTDSTFTFYHYSHPSVAFFSQDLTISFIQHNHFSFPLLTLLYCYHHHDPHWLTQSLDFFYPI